uniref:CFEM domain-containing protein n=1 Tax=Schizophyllum commune (strain H4-8 / FGSC 9210) TaxID=578458 RepID=D8Q5P0_SCHCM
MKSTLFLLLLAVVAIAQKDTSGDDDEQDDNDETSTDADDSDTTTHHGSKTASSSKHTESAQPNSQKCIVGCTAPIARQYGCTSIRDFPCVCNSEDFMSDMENCLKKECTADQRDSAVGMIKGNCGAYATKTSMLATQISTQEAGWANYGNGASHLPVRRPRALQASQPASCNARTDLQCVCTSASFQDDAKSCLQDNCTEEEQQTALQLQAAECAAIGGTSESGSAATSTGASATSSASASSSASSASGTRTSSGSGATSTGPSSTTSDADASATDSNAASGLHHEFFLVGGVVAPVIAVEIGGLMFGAAMVML